jgi:membrane associated rhomboid family serine protease
VRRQIIIGPDTKIARAGGRPPLVVAGLLVQQVGFFIVWAFADGPAWVARHLAASASRCYLQHELWQPLSALFVHLSSRSLLVNAVALWIFGSALERFWGTRRFLLFWLTTGALGLALGTALGLLLPHEVVGGSAGAAAGLIAAFGLVFRGHWVSFYGVLPLKAGPLAVVLAGFLAVGNLLGAAYMELAVQAGGAGTALLFLFRSRPRRAPKTDVKHKLQVLDGGKKDSPRYWN